MEQAAHEGRTRNLFGSQLHGTLQVYKRHAVDLCSVLGDYLSKICIPETPDHFPIEKT